MITLIPLTICCSHSISFSIFLCLFAEIHLKTLAIETATSLFVFCLYFYARLTYLSLFKTDYVLFDNCFQLFANIEQVLCFTAAQVVVIELMMFHVNMTNMLAIESQSD